MSEVLRDLGIHDAVHQQKALVIWPDVVGQHIARIATAERIEGGILFVRVDNPSWRAEIFQRRHVIRARLNAELAGNHVRDIVLV